MRKKNVKISFYIAITLSIIAIGLLYRKYTEYKYLKSDEMKIVTNGMSQFLRGYQRNYNRYPDDGSAFIEYLEKDNEFYDILGVKLPDIIKNRQIAFLLDTINNRIIVFSYTTKNKREISKISEMNFIDYILGCNFELFNDSLLDICYWSDNHTVKLFRGKKLIKNDFVIQKIKKIIKLFIIRNVEKKYINPATLHTFYFYGINKGDTLRFSLVCDPSKGKINYSSIKDSLSFLLNDIVKENSITELYIPIITYNEFLPYSNLNIPLSQCNQNTKEAIKCDTP